MESIRGRKLATFSWLYPHHIFRCAGVAVSSGLLHLLELGRDEKHDDRAVRFLPRPCKNVWSRGGEQPRVSAVRVAGVQHVSDAVVARRLARVRCRHFDDGTVLKSDILSAGATS